MRQHADLFDTLRNNPSVKETETSPRGWSSPAGCHISPAIDIQ